MLDPAIVESIRAIFLHHEQRVTLDEAARMLGWTRARLNEAIEAEEFSVVETCGGKRMIEIRELAHYAVYEWPFHVIEKALGREASLIIPPALRTRKITHIAVGDDGPRNPLQSVSGLKRTTSAGRHQRARDSIARP